MVRITVTSGATGNMIRQSAAVRLGCAIKKITPIGSPGRRFVTSDHNIGETSIGLLVKNNAFAFTGLVVQNVDGELLTGTPLMEINDVAILPANLIISLTYGTTCRPYRYCTAALKRHAIRRAHVLQAPLTVPCGLANLWRPAYPPPCSLQTAHYSVTRVWFE